MGGREDCHVSHTAKDIQSQHMVSGRLSSGRAGGLSRRPHFKKNLEPTNGERQVI